MIVQFNVGQNEILGIFDDIIHVIGSAFYDKENEEEIDFFDCVIKLDRDEYMRVFNVWLDNKMKLCVTYNDYVEDTDGVIAKDFYEDEPVMLTCYNTNTDKMEKKETPCFYVINFDTTFDEE